jgi:hypothetical protein
LRQQGTAYQALIRFCKEGVGVQLGDDLPGTGSNPADAVQQKDRGVGMVTGARSIVGKPDSYGLRAETVSTAP